MNPAKTQPLYKIEYSVTIRIGDVTKTRIDSVTSHLRAPASLIYEKVAKWYLALEAAGIVVPKIYKMSPEIMILTETRVKLPPSPAQLAARTKRSSAGGLARAAKIRAAKAAASPGSPATPATPV